MSLVIQKRLMRQICQFISSIWHIDMKESNVITAFETSGILPLNKGKYDISRFDIRPFEKYQKWAAPRKPELDWASYTSAVASGGVGGAFVSQKFCQVAKVFCCCYPSILTGKTPNFMLIIFYTMRNVVFLVIKATL